MRTSDHLKQKARESLIRMTARKPDRNRLSTHSLRRTVLVMGLETDRQLVKGLGRSELLNILDGPDAHSLYKEHSSHDGARFVEAY